MGSNRHEAPEVGAMIGRMLNALVKRASEGDTEAIEQLQLVERQAVAAMTAGLAGAHDRAGYSWGELSTITGSSRQNVSQRVARAESTVAPLTVCGHVECIGRKRCTRLAS